jgi:hypothetical protein
MVIKGHEFRNPKNRIKLNKKQRRKINEELNGMIGKVKKIKMKKKKQDAYNSVLKDIKL